MISEEFTIRPMRDEDAGRVAELCGQLGYPSSADDIRKRFGSIAGDCHDECSVVEAPSGEIVAWVHLHLSTPMVSGKRVEIWGLVVDEAWRGQGVGGRLMEFAEEWTQAKGCGSLWLKSNIVRDRAHAFYERLGYETVKTQRVFRKELEPLP
jgi:GNAT superfamily N-acetyltransferase